MHHRTALAILLLVLLPGLSFAIVLAHHDPEGGLGLVTILASVASPILQSKPLRPGLCPFCDSPYPPGEGDACPDCGHALNEARSERRYGYIIAAIIILMGIGVIFVRMYWGIAALLAAIVALVIRIRFDIHQDKIWAAPKGNVPPQNPDNSH